MQGSRIALIVAVAAAVMGASFGCTVNNYPEPRPAQPPSPAQQQRQPQAQAVQPANAPPTPTTRNVPATPPPGAAQQSAPAPQPSASGKSYTIKPGDNLWNIAKEVYGDGTKYQRILDANPGLNPDNMKPGTKIVIP